MIFQTINPATGEIVRTFPTTSDEEVATALKTADDCYNNDWRLRTVAERAQIVKRAAALLRQNVEEYAGYMTLEMGKLAAEARNEIELSAAILEYYADRAEEFLKPQPLAEAPSSVMVIEPIGVLVAIEPWNFPYYQLARVAGPQLVAGNVVMFKHAPSVPQCALAFARLFEQAGAPEGVYTNLFCSVEQVGTLIDDFRVRGVTLTGSEARRGASAGPDRRPCRCASAQSTGRARGRRAGGAACRGGRDRFRPAPAIPLCAPPVPSPSAPSHRS
jgi:succinate-semialdehyde dehydrogenase / glutarate-semialdehyde dehydrogenase